MGWSGGGEERESVGKRDWAKGMSEEKEKGYVTYDDRGAPALNDDVAGV